jgi:UDP-glucose 4-epimerase
MSNILVTGGAGFIGSHTVVELVESGYNPVIVDNLQNSKAVVLEKLEKLLGRRVTSYQQDYQDIAALQKVIQKESITGIIHFAADKAVGESVSNPLKYYDNNVAGFIKLLEFCETSPIKHIVFSSSCTVYGEPDHVPVSEQSPFKPAESPYGATKQMCETILRDATKVSEKFNSITLRYFNPIGAHPSSLIGELPLGVPANLVPFVTQAAAGIRDKLTVFGDDYPTPDGTCVRDYIHVVDLAKAHVHALRYLEKQESATGTELNIGTGKGCSVLEVIRTFEKATGVKVPYRIGQHREGDVIETYADTKLAKSLLGWKAEKTISDALADAWRWQQTL